FGRSIRPDLFFSAYRKYENVAKKLKINIEEKGFKIYKSDIKKRLVENNGFLSHQDLKDLIFLAHKSNGAFPMAQQNTTTDLSWLDLSILFGDSDFPRFENQDFSGPIAWYQEWDHNLQDYLRDYVRVLEQTITCQSGDFYDLTLQRYSGLIKKIRYAFDLLKPEGLIRLRQWIEGDEFDYRAMLDYVLDKKAGKIPSERLYIKHIKQLRDVSVLLLVDLSRSTANPILGSQATVMDVEKEAIVLFCEALEVVGDAFSIAGFSGTGRLGVDYLRVKDFDEKIDDTIKQRIDALSPRRGTRMGAAIRHATRQLERALSKVRLLIILSDGFPNDVDYKQNYAVEDTRKAISEARSKNIYTHGITINIAADSKLDDLYGNIHHNVISDVRELPDKLLRIYSGLTRH
ncbi:MAG: VWA domain-containing protein, partial [Desulfobacterales bacterium]